MGPVRDQGNIGWCYAHATADIIGYAFDRQLTKPVAALSIALMNNHINAKRFLTEGGTVERTLSRALRTPMYEFDREDYLKVGFCDLEREKVFLGNPSNETEVRQYLRALFKVKEDFDNQMVKAEDLAPELLNLVRRSTQLDFSLRVAELICGPNRNYNTRGKVNKHFSDDDANLVAHIDTQLNKTNIIGIGIYSDFIQKENGKFNKSDLHAAIIVGRRISPKSNKCEYLVRNSWGTDPDKYSKHVTEVIDGNLWIPANLIKENVFEIDYIEKY